MRSSFYANPRPLEPLIYPHIWCISSIVELYDLPLASRGRVEQIYGVKFLLLRFLLKHSFQQVYVHLVFYFEAKQLLICQSIRFSSASVKGLILCTFFAEVCSSLSMNLKQEHLFSPQKELHQKM